MATPVWSVRWILTNAPGWTYFVCGSGQRLVVKNWGAYNATPATKLVAVGINGLAFWASSVQTKTASFAASQHVVVYPGETIGMYLETSDMSGQVSGYELHDTAVASEQPLPGPITPPPPWPAP